MKRITALACGLVALLTAGSPAAQPIYPEKPIRILVGFPPGSAPDIAARLLGHRLAESLGKPVLIENVTGAAGNIAADRVAKAAADGHTLALAANAQITVNPSLYKLPYDPIRDFAPVSQVYVTSSILAVTMSAPVQSVKELVALAKAQPGALTFASGGSGSSPHLAAALFKSATGIEVREIPYKGVVAAIPDLLAGRVTMMFPPIAVIMPAARDGKLRALAVTSLRRSSAVPELPTIDESGYPGFEATLWGGLLAPAGTAATVVRKLHLETTNALARTDIRAKLGELGLDIVGNSPEEFAAVIRSEIPKWAKLIRESGIRPD